MADNYYGSISIPKSLLTQEVMHWIEMEGLKKEGEYEGIVSFYDPLAVNGQFDQLEARLVEAKIPFDRNSEGYCDNLPEVRYFRPNLLDHTVTTLRSGERFIQLEELRPLLLLSPSEAYKKLATLLNEIEPDVISLEEFSKMYSQVG